MAHDDEPISPYQLHTDALTVMYCNITSDCRLDGVLLQERLGRLRGMARTNLHLAICSLVYVGINICTLVMNSMDADFRRDHKLLFHRTEFWATFFFACLQVYALVGCPRQLQDIFRRPFTVKCVMVLNVVATLVPAGLVTVSLDYFEVCSHEVEYSNEITMAILDMIFVYSLVKKHSLRESGLLFQFAATVLTLAIAVIQLGIYNGLGGTHGGPGEQLAHYFEFVFEGFSGFISFLFCIDCKPLGQRWLSTEHRTASGCYFCPLDVDLRSTAARYFEAKP
ncbi:unnamed protein product [Effrenium voratum]|nr:unnamed protein product [Effrenium voratum]